MGFRSYFPLFVAIHAQKRGISTAIGAKNESFSQLIFLKNEEHCHHYGRIFQRIQNLTY